MSKAKASQQPSEGQAAGLGAVHTGRNLELWNRVFATDPKQTKEFNRRGGFSGTAIKPFWLIMRATEEFGPLGKGWGWEVLEDQVERTSDAQQAIWFSKVRLWYRLEEGGETYWTGPQWGATELLAKRRDGTIFFDEEAAKKSVTDALTKCLSYLGFAGDVHMGLFDDNKYVSARMEEEAAREKHDKQRAAEQKAAAEETPEQRKAALEWLNGQEAAAKACRTSEELKAFWEKLKPHYEKMDAGSPAERQAAFTIHQTVTKLARELKKPQQQAAE